MRRMKILSAKMKDGSIRKAEVRLSRQGYTGYVEVKSPLIVKQTARSELRKVIGWNLFIRPGLYIMFGRKGWETNFTGGRVDEM